MSDALHVATEIRQYVAGGRVVERLIRVTRPDGTTVDIPTHGMTHHEAIGFAVEYVQRHDSKEKQMTPPADPITTLAAAAAGLNEFYLALVEAGFTEAQAFELVRASITPKEER